MKINIKAVLETDNGLPPAAYALANDLALQLPDHDYDEILDQIQEAVK
jgi:hypothetical protein